MLEGVTGVAHFITDYEQIKSCFFFFTFLRFLVHSVLVNDPTFRNLFKKKDPTTVDPQWLEHLWNHENMLEIGVVRANEC